MEISDKLRAQLEEIIRQKRFALTPEELAQDFQKADRLAPCAHFSALSAILHVNPCKLGYELDCLNCSNYEPHEPPGPLEPAICVFENGKVYHVMEFAESDGFYRQGMTLCGRFVDEEADDVEIYGGETLSGMRLCKKCSAKGKSTST
jgi:hypothetical protein